MLNLMRLMNFNCVNHDPRLLYVYEWKLCIAAVNAVNEKLSEKDQALTKYMHLDLHCAAHIHIEGPDDKYEKEWFRKLDEPEMLLKMLSWDEHCCAVVVGLSRLSKRPSKPHPFTMEGSVPQVSLSTHCDLPWQDIEMVYTFALL